MMCRVYSFSVLALAIFVAAGCAGTAGREMSPTGPAPVSPSSPAAGIAQAVANLASASGSLVSGRLTLAPVAGGVRVSGQVGGLTPGGAHAFHIHEKGDCSAADASSAGGHFNPTGQPHGRAGHGAHHLGDNDNLQANAEGVAMVEARFLGATLGDGGTSDVLGKAIVVHAAADDYASQPAGNAGARVACGVIVAGG